MALRSEKVNWHRVSNSAFKKTLLKHASSQINKASLFEATQ